MEHDESSVDDISNAMQSGKLKSLSDILQVCRDGGLHKNNKEEPFKGANNETWNHKQADAHQKAHTSDQYPEVHSLARIHWKRRRTNGRKSLADVISTCRSEGKQAFHDVANAPASDLARIEELQREMGVDIANTKIHVSDAKLRRRQSKLSMSSSGTILTGSGSVVNVSTKTSRDNFLPSTTKSSSQRTPIIPPECEISSEDWLQIRMRNRSKRYRQSKSELLKGNGNLERDNACTVDSTTTNTMERNLVTHLKFSDTFKEDTSGDGMSPADPQLAAEKKVDGTEVTKMTDENMRSNEHNHINSETNSEKENVLEEVKIKDGNVTLVLYKVKEESFLKMKHEYQNSESKGIIDDSISISYNNKHDCTDTYKSEDACNTTRLNDNLSPLKGTYTEKDLPDSASRRRSHSRAMPSEAYNSTRTNDNASPLKDTYIEKDETYSDRRRGSHSFSLTSDVPIESQMKTKNEGMNNQRGVLEHNNEFIPNTFNYSQARTAPVPFEQNTTEQSENKDIHTLDTVLFKENIQSEKDAVNGKTYATVSSECIKASNGDDFQNSNIQNTSTNKTELKERMKAYKTSENHGEERQENNNPQSHAEKSQAHKQKEHIILKSKKIANTHKVHEMSLGENKDAVIVSDPDSNDTATSIETARQSVDSDIVLANILEDQRSTVTHATNRGRVLKTRHSSGDLARRGGQSSGLSSNSTLLELKSKPRQVNPGLDVASKIVDSRKQFYQNGTVHSEEIREHRIMKLFREIQRVRNMTVFPGSFDVIEDEFSGFLMIDYDKQHRVCTFSDREAIDRFLYKPVEYELCCKIKGVSANFRRKEKAFKALQQKQVHSKVSYVNVISMTIEEI